MDKIYRGAWATIVALSARSAESGLPRVRVRPEPASKSFSQSCRWNELQLNAILPSLSQQIQTSKWQTRAWTFQEAILSPRCVFVSHDQAYFECNRAQCCENIDESKSPWHHREKSRFTYGTDHGDGIFRDPFLYQNTETTLKFRFGVNEYEKLVRQYSLREMSFSSDALDAFAAVLDQLTNAAFPNGSYWGLPVEALPNALLWQHRQPPKRRSSFPSWSWTGWEGELFQGAEPESENAYRVPFNAWKVDQTSITKLALINSSDRDDWRSETRLHRKIGGHFPWRVPHVTGDDPVCDFFATIPNTYEPPAVTYGLDLSQSLVVHAMVFEPGHLRLDTTPTAMPIVDVKPNLSTFVCTVNEVKCEFTCTNDGTKESMLDCAPALLLIDRSSICHYDFLVLSWIGDPKDRIAYRVGRVRMSFFLDEWKSSINCTMAVFTRENLHSMLVTLY
jgi:hypothetical protein